MNIDKTSNKAIGQDSANGSFFSKQVFKTGYELQQDLNTSCTRLNTKNNKGRGVQTPLNTRDEDSCTPMGVHLDTFDIDICKLAHEQHHIRSIAKLLNRPPASVKYRLDKLLKAGLVSSYTGAYKTKLFKLSTRLTQFLIHSEEQPPANGSGPGGREFKFTAHSVSVKFPILDGSQPTHRNKANQYKMNNWTGYTWNDHPDYTIVSTPRNIRVDVKVELGADNINDLNIKYVHLASNFILKWADQKGVKLGTPGLARDPHYTVKDHPLAEIITERGEFLTKNGIKMDGSQSNGDLELQKMKTALSYDWVINAMPGQFADFKTQFEQFQGNIDNRLDGIEGNIRGLSMFVELLERNRQLEEQNKDLVDRLQSVETIISSINPDPVKKDPDINYQ